MMYEKETCQTLGSTNHTNKVTYQFIIYFFVFFLIYFFIYLFLFLFIFFFFLIGKNFSFPYIYFLSN